MTMIRMIGSLGIWNLFVLVLVCTAWALTPAAGADELKYQSPPGPIARIVDVPPTPSASLSPDRRTALLIERPSFMSIEEVSQPELRLAGIRINPKTNGPSRGSYISKLYLLDLTTPQAKPVFIEGLPANDHLSYPSWSPD